MSTRPCSTSRRFRLFTLTDNTLEISGRRLKAAGVRDLFERRFSVDETVRRHKPGQLALDPAVSPCGVLTGRPENQGLDVPAGGRSAGRAPLGSGGPAAARDVAVPAQDRVRGDQQPQPLTPRFRYHAEQHREQCPVRPVQVRPTRLLPLQYGELVAQDQDLRGLPCLLMPGQLQP
jgi:hypothetical protein